MYQESGNAIFIVFIGIFLAFSGLYSIVVSMNSLGQHKSDSSIETKYFKFNAPVGITYGIVALLSVVGLVYFDRYQDRLAFSNQLEAENTELKYRNHKLRTTLGDSARIISEVFKYEEPKSIFNGRVLIAIDGLEINFTGIVGIAKTMPIGKGPVKFSRQTIAVEQGKRFFILLRDMKSIWGVNILKDYGREVTLEFYKEATFTPYEPTRAPATRNTLQKR
ncbi:hypothetical protein [Hymenobacter sp.]|jgi:hypothetical protein|uniref:hypothetical protein n=1 Tax=Hymenobacter sp. TaxID=1898978 RepID=UPI002ED82515